MPGFLTREYYNLPMWVWIGIGVGGVLLYRSLQGGSQPVTSNANQPVMSGNNGNETPPNIWFLPQGASTSSGSDITVNVNRFPGNGPISSTPGTPASNTPPPTSGPIPAPNPPPNFQPAYQTVTVDAWPGISPVIGEAQWNTTLWGIAHHFGTSVDELATINNISNPNLIYPGQQIKVPIS